MTRMMQTHFTLQQLLLQMFSRIISLSLCCCNHKDTTLRSALCGKLNFSATTQRSEPAVHADQQPTMAKMDSYYWNLQDPWQLEHEHLSGFVQRELLMKCRSGYKATMQNTSSLFLWLSKPRRSWVAHVTWRKNVNESSPVKERQWIKSGKRTWMNQVR